jgi:hypothetical protein
MKNTNLLGHLICLITNDCNSDQESINEDEHEEIEVENVKEGFQAFDIDYVFSN